MVEGVPHTEVANIGFFNARSDVVLGNSAIACVLEIKLAMKARRRRRAETGCISLLSPINEI